MLDRFDCVNRALPFAAVNLLSLGDIAQRPVTAVLSLVRISARVVTVGNRICQGSEAVMHMLPLIFTFWLFAAAGRDVAVDTEVVRPVVTEASIEALPELHHARRFHHDLRQPRRPRHRSERPTSLSFGDLFDSKAAIDAIVQDDAPRSLLALAVVMSPLSGHPLEVLRPPSAAA